MIGRYLSRSDPDRCGYVVVFAEGVTKEVLCNAPTARIKGTAGAIVHAPVCAAHLPMWPEIDVIGAVRGGFRPTWLEMLAGCVRAGWMVPVGDGLSVPTATSTTTTSAEQDHALVDALLESGAITDPIANMARSMTLPRCDLHGPRQQAHALAAAALDAAVDGRLQLAEVILRPNLWVEEFSLADKVGREAASSFERAVIEAFERFALHNLHKLSPCSLKILHPHVHGSELRVRIAQRLSMLTAMDAIQRCVP